MPNKKKVLNLTEYAKIIIIQKIIKKEQKIYHEKKTKITYQSMRIIVTDLSEDESKKKKSAENLWKSLSGEKKEKLREQWKSFHKNIKAK